MAKDTNEEILGALADVDEAVGKRFDQTGEQIGEVRSDLNRFENNAKNQFAEVNKQLMDINLHFDRVDQQLTYVLERLNRIEELILQDHSRRIEALERKVGTTR